MEQTRKCLEVDSYMAAMSEVFEETTGSDILSSNTQVLGVL